MGWEDTIEDYGAKAKKASWEDTIEDHEPESLGSKTLKAAEKVGEAVDGYGGDASTRAGIFALQNGKNPLKAALHQYGDSKSAPTGKMIAEKGIFGHGVEDKPFPQAVQDAGNLWKDGTLAGQAYKHLVPQGIQDSIGNASKSDVAGLGVEIGASPLSFGVKGAAKGLSTVGKYIKNKMAMGASHVAGAFTGAPARDIYTYGAHGREVKPMIKGSEGNYSKLADDVRTGYQKDIRSTREGHNKTIRAAGEAADKEKTISSKTILDALEEKKEWLSQHMDKDQIIQIDKLIDDVKLYGDQIPPAELIKITKSLQDRGAYGVDAAGKIMGNTAKKAATSAGQESLLLRNEHIPGVAEPFEKLERINEIGGDQRVRNALKPKTPDGTFYAAGAGKNQAAEKALEEMGKATNTDMLHKARLASSARTFGTPSLTPLDTTGKSLFRYAVAKDIPGIKHIAQLVTSPAALKVLIDAGRVPAEVIGSITGKTIGRLTPDDYATIYKVLKTSQAENARSKTFEHIKKRKQSVK